MLYEVRDGRSGEVMEPDSNGGPVPTTFNLRILKKLNKLVEQVYEESKNG